MGDARYIAPRPAQLRARANVQETALGDPDTAADLRAYASMLEALEERLHPDSGMNDAACVHRLLGIAEGVSDG